MCIRDRVYIAIYSPNEAIRIKQIAEDTGITVAYLEQIFFLLKKAGLLLTVRGAKGGFLLAQSPKDVYKRQTFHIFFSVFQM